MRSAVIALLVAGIVAPLAACRDGTPGGPTDRAWTTADFERVAAASSCAALPTSGSPAFARMTDPHVLDTLVSAEQAPAARLGGLIDYQNALAAITKHYASCGDLGGHLAMATALIELMAFELPVADAFVATLPADDPTREVRAGGVAKMREGLQGMATGIALTVRGSRFPRPVPGVGRRLGAALARVVPLMPAGALDGALGNLDVPEDGDDDRNRRALRADIRAGLHDARATPPRP